MKDTTYFKCTIKIEYEDAKGRVKFKKESYIVPGVSPTDVEEKMTKYINNSSDYEIVSISIINIVDILE